MRQLELRKKPRNGLLSISACCLSHTSANLLHNSRRFVRLAARFRHSGEAELRFLIILFARYRLLSDYLLMKSRSERGKKNIRTKRAQQLEL